MRTVRICKKLYVHNYFKDNFLFQEKGEMYVKQLMVSTLPLPQVKVKFLGSTGVGKSTLIETLKCGLFSSFFRRSRLSSSGASPGPSSSSKPSPSVKGGKYGKISFHIWWPLQNLELCHISHFIFHGSFLQDL